MPGIQRGAEWVRVALPAAATFSTEALNLVNAPIKQASAPTNLTVHSGSAGNIRLSLDWQPPSGMIGFHVVPWVGGSEFPGRALLLLGEYRPDLFVQLNNTAAPATFYAVRVVGRLNEQALYYEIFFARFSRSIGIQASAEIRIYPALAA